MTIATLLFYFKLTVLFKRWLQLPTLTFEIEGYTTHGVAPELMHLQILSLHSEHVLYTPSLQHYH